MNFQQFQSLMSAVQSLIVALGIIIGGIWSLITFTVLRKVYQTRLELQKAEADIQKTQVERQRIEADIQKAQLELQKLDLEVRTQAVIEISIEASQTALPNDTSRYVSAIVDIENRGSRNTRLSFEGREPFSVTPVKINETGSLEFGARTGFSVPRASQPMGVSPSTVVRTGGRERLPFFFKVDSPGLYFITFTAELSSDEQEVARATGVTRPTSWVGKKYLVVV